MTSVQTLLLVVTFLAFGVSLAGMGQTRGAKRAEIAAARRRASKYDELDAKADAEFHEIGGNFATPEAQADWAKKWDQVFTLNGLVRVSEERWLDSLKGDRTDELKREAAVENRGLLWALIGLVVSTAAGVLSILL